MKRLRIITFACLIVSAVLLAVSSYLRAVRADSTLPSIRIPEQPLVLSVADHGTDALLEGVTASDKKDGDLTGRILLQDVTLQEGNRMKATYAVVDSSRHVASASRIVEYEDYVPPRFYLSAPLRYTPGSSIQIKDRLTAFDVIDGDLSDQIRVNANNLMPYYEGTYPVTFEVTNSLGGTAGITLDVTVQSPEPGEPAVRLSKYLIYLRQGDAFDPTDYLESDGGNTVSAALPQGGLQKGVNTVTYSCTGANGVSGSTVLYVVVE